MIERWTIDAIADEIEAQFKGADPKRKLLRRFYREGKRFGGDEMSTDPMRQMLINAVGIATNRLAQEYLGEEHAAEKTRVGYLARQKMLEEDQDDEDGEDSESSEKRQSDEQAAASPPNPPPTTSGPDLRTALGALQSRRQKEAALQRIANLEAERQRRENDLDTLDEQLAVLATQIEDLPERYLQLIESCHETGELLWSRFCTGYVQGASGRGAANQKGRPDLEIEFEYPDVLDPEDDDPDDSEVAASDAETASLEPPVTSTATKET